MFKTLLAHPLTRGLDIDDPRTTRLRRQIIQQKPFLRRIYQEWYTMIAKALPMGEEPVLELGAGAGFMADYIPSLITSEVFYCTDIRVVLDGQWLPFADRTLRGIVMTDVLHHMPQPRRFLAEAARCVRPGGVIVMIEPWVTRWSRWVYGRLHHEPFRPDAVEWEFPSSGPLSDANGALPWIIFDRDRIEFEQEFPEWQIKVIQPMMPFRYLVSGGVSLRSLMPAWGLGLWRRVEKVLAPFDNYIAMFAEIVLRRQR